MSDARPIAVRATDVPPRTKPSNYPEPFFSRMGKREKRQLGDVFGLKNFGVNLTRLSPGGESALLHRHSKQDEFIYILEGRPTLVTDGGEIDLAPGMCAGFPDQGVAHQLVNRTQQDVLLLEVGDRTSGDEGSYPRDDLQAVLSIDGKWAFTHKDGRPYQEGLSIADLPIGKVGRILAGKDAGWYVKILDDVGSTGGYLILTARDPDFRDGFDDWVENEVALAGYIEESGWLIEWMP